MNIPGLFGVLLVISTSEAQEGIPPGLNLPALLGDWEAAGKAFGESLTEKLLAAMTEVVSGTFTLEKGLDLLGGLTEEEKDGAVRGLVVLVQELEKVTSAPETKSHLRLALDFAPMILRQAVRSAGPTKTEAVPKKVDDVVLKLKPNETVENSEDEGDMMGGLESVIESLLESGQFPFDLLGMMDGVDIPGEEETPEESTASDDNPTATLSQNQDKPNDNKDEPKANVDKPEQSGGGGGVGKDDDQPQTDKDEL